MHSLTLLLSILSLSLLSSALPTPAPDSAMLLANAQEAQKLNAEFANLTSTDPCQDGDYACVGGAEATCVNNTWQSTPCPQGGDAALSCFAIPSVRHPGTINACISENTAVALIEALGATGGIDGSGNDPSADPTAADSNGYGGDNGSNDAGSTTITLTVTSTPTVTLEPTTTTMPLTALGDLTSGAPAATDAAAAVVGAPSPATITLNSAAPTPPPSVNGALGDTGALPTITLTNAPVATPAAAAAADPAPAADPATTSPSTDGGYGYGGY